MLSQFLHFPAVNIPIRILNSTFLAWNTFIPLANYSPFCGISHFPCPVELFILEFSLILSSIFISQETLHADALLISPLEILSWFIMDGNVPMELVVLPRSSNFTTINVESPLPWRIWIFLFNEGYFLVGELKFVIGTQKRLPIAKPFIFNLSAISLYIHLSILLLLSGWLISLMNFGSMLYRSVEMAWWGSSSEGIDSKLISSSKIVGKI